jgi:hypothetical protein
VKEVPWNDPRRHLLRVVKLACITVETIAVIFTCMLVAITFVNYQRLGLVYIGLIGLEGYVYVTAYRQGKS